MRGLELDQLRTERRAVRRVAERLVSDAPYPINNDAGKERRAAVLVLLDVCARRERRAIPPNLLLAAQMIIAYDDRTAAAILQAVCDEWFLREIKKEKARK